VSSGSWRRGAWARWRAILATVAVGLAYVLAVAPSPATVASQQASSSPSVDAARSVSEYWSAERMRSARPAGLLLDAAGRPRPRAAPPGKARTPVPRASAVDASANPTAFPDRTNGKVFFTVTGGSSPGDYVCSATVVRSSSHTLVWTAGHCVNDAEFGGGFAANWAFVPGYREGARPFGTWPARRLFTTGAWSEHADVRQDLGAARLARDAEGRGVEDVLGARKIGFGLARQQQFTAFGYPALPTLFHPEFNGERLYACASPTTGSDNPPGNGPEPLEISCDMTGGASGGAWVTAGGAVNSVTSYGYLSDLTHLYGPYMGEAARDLHRVAGGPRRTCAKWPATNLGGAGRDAFTGTEARDAFKLRGGRDQAAGGRGGDRLCGDGGRDRLAGGGGNDRLRGSGGNDVLVGGGGRDICDGGAGRDRARGCERRRRIP
jgi:hypothetical protein